MWGRVGLVIISGFYSMNKPVDPFNLPFLLHVGFDNSRRLFSKPIRTEEEEIVHPVPSKGFLSSRSVLHSNPLSSLSKEHCRK